MGKILLDAQNGNLIYGQSETIQPLSGYSLMIIKDLPDGACIVSEEPKTLSELDARKLVPRQ